MNSQILTESLTRQAFLRRASATTLAVAFGESLSRTVSAAPAGGGDFVHVSGTFVLGAASAGIDPLTQPVTFRLLVPSGDRVYPAGADFMPLTGFVPTPDGWALSDAEKARTGLRSFMIGRTDVPGHFTFNVVDTRTALALRDYSDVRVELRIGDDAGGADRTLVARNGLWALS